MPISRQELGWFLHHTTTFVECGSAGGQGIQAALEAGYSQIHSVDINPACVQECIQLYKNYPNVFITHGDCGQWLETTLNQLNKPCAIYMDANGWAQETESPYHASIRALKRHGRKDHIVVVDDMNHNNSSRAGMMQDLRRSLNSDSDQDVIKQLVTVNPNYYLYLEDSHSVDFKHTYPSWILIGSPIPLSLNCVIEKNIGDA